MSSSHRLYNNNNVIIVTCDISSNLYTQISNVIIVMKWIQLFVVDVEQNLIQETDLSMNHAYHWSLQISELGNMTV